MSAVTILLDNISSMAPVKNKRRSDKNPLVGRACLQMPAMLVCRPDLCMLTSGVWPMHLQVFFKVKIGDQPIGTIVFELFKDVAPKARSSGISGLLAALPSESLRACLCLADS